MTIFSRSSLPFKKSIYFFSSSLVSIFGFFILFKTAGFEDNSSQSAIVAIASSAGAGFFSCWCGFMASNQNIHRSLKFIDHFIMVLPIIPPVCILSVYSYLYAFLFALGALQSFFLQRISINGRGHLTLVWGLSVSIFLSIFLQLNWVNTYTDWTIVFILANTLGFLLFLLLSQSTQQSDLIVASGLILKFFH